MTNSIPRRPSAVDIEYAFRDTTDSGCVAAVEAAVRGVSNGLTHRDSEPAAGNDAVVPFDGTETGDDPATPSVVEPPVSPAGDIGKPPTDPGGDGRYGDVAGDVEFGLVSGRKLCNGVLV